LKHSKDLTEGKIPPAIISLAIPMFLGMLAIMLFQLADTYFLGQLGADELAAMGFIFPVFFAVHSLVFGLGGGATALVSIAYGKKDFDSVRKLTTHSILLGLTVVILISMLGFLTITPLFTALGASGHILDLIEQYVVIYYATVLLLVLPMIANSANRAVGDTKSPAIIMSISAGVNIILDPIFIFGFGPVPPMGMQGAAIATSLAWVITFIASFYIIGVRLKMLELSIPVISQVLDSWKQILHIGAPASAANLVMPISVALITSFVAIYGNEAVAGFGAATRVESLAIIGIFAISASLSPFVGQNFGAKEIERIKQGVNFSFKSAISWGLGVSLIIYFFATPIASLFSQNPQVINSSVLYFTIVPICYWAWGVSMLVYSTLYSLKKPLWAGALIVLRLFIFMVPLAYLGSNFFGLTGLFAGMALAEILGAGASYFLYSKLMKEISKPEYSKPD